MTAAQQTPLTITTKLEDRILAYQERVESRLRAALKLEQGAFPVLYQAMEYSLLAGGKRLRPLLVYASAETLALEPAHVDSLAVSLELIHTYSLIHDDLPAMDDDDLRRGHPACHIAFDEATAILAGDALLTLAFRVLGESRRRDVSAEAQLQVMAQVAQACGATGMAGGQAMDLVNKSVGELDELKQIYLLKTGALFQSAITGPLGYASREKSSISNLLNDFAEKLGLAFQIYDDFLDVAQSTEILGKPAFSDQAQNKSTYPSIVGIEKTRQIANDLAANALETLQRIDGNTQLLHYFAEKIVSRSH